MAPPNISSTVNFVKKYPITLCGFSLLFMPSVHRLLLYFTPLLLSTAIFIVAMLSWGPSMPSAERGKKRGRPSEWAFNGSLKIYEEEAEEEEEEEELIEVPQRKLSEDIMQQEAISVKENAIKKLEPKLQEPDPDFDENSNLVGIASNGAVSGGQAEPDPDLCGDCVGTASNGAISGTEAEPDPDLSGDYVGTASNGAISGTQAEPDPDLSGDCVGMASNCGQAEPDPDLHGDRDVGAACSDEPDLAGDHSHGEQHVEPAHDQDFPASNHLHAPPDHHHHLPASHDDYNHAEPAPNNRDQQAAGDHDLDYHDAETDHLNYGDGDHLNHVDFEDADPNNLYYHDAEPDPDLHGEAAVHAKSEGANDHLPAAIAELRQKLGMMKRTPYSDDSRDMHSQQLAERLQTLQAAA